MNAQEHAEWLAEQVRRSPYHTVKVTGEKQEWGGTIWSVRIIGNGLLDRSGMVYWVQPRKGRAYLGGGWLDKYADYKKNISLGRYDYRTLRSWLYVCVLSYIPEEEP